MITVVIPYFQRTEGVLRKALASIAAQRDCPLPIHVIVVDDSSPVPAAGEIAAAALPDTIGMALIRQANAGPGAARNTGLNAAPPATRYIAFLDSDDEWSAEHLARATVALQPGYDVFFGYHLQLDQKIGAFERGRRLNLAEHTELTNGSGLHAYVGDMFDQILRGNLIGTSTVVLDFQRFKDLRFRVEFSNAGEDYLFWLELTQLNARFVFSSKIEAIYGRGVNIYSASGWGTDQYALRVHNEMKFRKTVQRLFQLNGEQEQRIQTNLAVLRRSFAEDLLNRVSHGRKFDRSLLIAQWQLDRPSFYKIPAVLCRKLLRFQ